MSDEVDGGAECSKSEFYQLPKYTLKIKCNLDIRRLI